MRSADDRRRSLKLGYEAEDHVEQVLVAEGWQVLARNWRCAAGELDRVVRLGGVLRFVEVKAREPGDGLDGLDAMTPAKQARLVRAAEAWLDEYGDRWEEQAFLLALVSLSDWTIQWIDNPFDG